MNGRFLYGQGSARPMAAREELGSYAPQQRRATLRGAGGVRAPDESVSDVLCVLLEPSAAGRDGLRPGVETLRLRAERLLSHMTVSMALAGLTAAAATGGVGAHAWDAHQEQVDRDTISLSLGLDPALTSIGDRDRMSARSDTVDINAGVVVTNTGPLPVEMSGVRANLPGLTLIGGPAQTIPAGSTTTVTTSVMIRCAVEVPTQPITVSASVRTANGKTHATALPLPDAGTQWQRLDGPLCDASGA
jgi:hypothetical protein